MSCSTKGLLPSDFSEWKTQHSETVGAWSHKSCVILHPSNDLLGDSEGLARWARGTLNWTGSALEQSDVSSQVSASTTASLLLLQQPLVFLSVGLFGAKEQTQVIIELFHDKCPRAADNFRSLCVGDSGKGPGGDALHYRGNPFHRVVRGGFVQGGDVAGGHGDGGISSFVGDSRPSDALTVPDGFVDSASKEGRFADEHLKLPHSTAGVVGMAGAGVPNSNAS